MSCEYKYTNNIQIAFYSTASTASPRMLYYCDRYPVRLARGKYRTIYECVAHITMHLFNNKRTAVNGVGFFDQYKWYEYDARYKLLQRFW